MPKNGHAVAVWEKAAVGSDSPPPRSRRSDRLRTMPLMRLIAENIGPFERLDIDFSDGNGKPHPGPHILAGVNGSGKSTVLRAIAWAMSWSESGFPGSACWS